MQAVWEIPKQRAILAASPYLSQVNTANAFYQQTGFWFYADQNWQMWQPDSALQHFLKCFPSPLLLSFNSLPLQDAPSVLALHVRAAAKLGCGLLVQRGWANFNVNLLPDDCDPDTIFFTDFIPHDWLLARVAAVIHRGGIGTLARAVRNNCPMLVEPYGNDQFFNAKQVLVHQIGTAAHLQRVTVDGLVRMLEQKVLTEPCRRNVQQLGEALQQRGHRVRMAFRRSMHDYVKKAGLEAIPCGTELSEETAREKASDWDEWQKPTLSSE